MGVERMNSDYLKFYWLINGVLGFWGFGVLGVLLSVSHVVKSWFRL